MTKNIKNTFMHQRRWSKLALGLMLAGVSLGSASISAAEPESYAAKSDWPAPPRKFDKWVTEKLGVQNVAYLLAVDVNGNVVPFVPNDPKASFRFFDPTQGKYRMEISNIAPFTIVAGKRNPFCVLFIGGSARRLWMESCP